MRCSWRKVSALVSKRIIFPSALALLFISMVVAFDGAASLVRAQGADVPTGGAPVMAQPLPPGPIVAQSPSPSPKPQPRSGSPLPHELSPWAMFLAADIVVKGVMIGLAFASVLVWTIWFAKLAELVFAKLRIRRTIAVLENCNTLAAASERAGNGKDALSLMVRSAQREVERLGTHQALHAGIKERVASELHRIEIAAGRQAAFGTGLLATIGSTAPFVGLFGTVWGIMNSFIGISKSQTTNLAVVAPGIAEALLATAVGLVAAIPAVIFYNQIARAIQSLRAETGDGGALIGRIVSRDLDARTAGPRLRTAAE